MKGSRWPRDSNGFGRDSLTLLPAGHTTRELTIDTQTIDGHAKVHNGDIHYHSSPRSPRRQNSQWASSSFPYKDRHREIQRKSKILSQSTFSECGYQPGQWLLESEPFVDWVSSNPLYRKLWYRGMPGAGKSVLASIIISHLLRIQSEWGSDQQTEEPRPAVAYLYLSHEKHHPPKELLGSVIHQITEGLTQVPEEAQEYWEHYRGGVKPPNSKTLADILHILVKDRRTYIVVDGLDEYDPAKRSQLLTQLQPYSEDLRILVFSRVFSNFDEATSDFRVERIQARESDVNLFVDHEFRTHQQLINHCKQKPDFENAIKREVQDGFRGMFSFVNFHMQKRLQESSPIKRRKDTWDYEAIDKLYHDTLERIKTREPNTYKLAHDTLFWIAFCRLPLKIEDLQYLMGRDNKSIREILQNSCRELITPVDGKVDFVHFTAQYSLRILAPSNLSINIARKCIEALESYCRVSYDKKSACSFVNYAANHLGYHLRYMNVSEHTKMIAELDRLLQTSTNRKILEEILPACTAASWNRKSWEATGNDELANHPGVTVMHLAAAIGWVPVVERYIRDPVQSTNINVLDLFGRTPVDIAIDGSHWDAVELLLKNGASLNLREKKAHTSLMKIAQQDRRDIVKRVLSLFLTTLIRKYIDTIGLDNIGPVGILYSTMPLVNWLFPYSLGFLSNQQPEVKPLQRFFEKVYGLFRGSAPPPEKDLLSHSLLLEAIVLGEAKVVEGLLGNGDIDFKWKSSFYDFHRSAMFLAVEFGHAPIVEMLLNSGANVNMRGLGDCVPLDRAEYRNHTDTIQVLARCGSTRRSINRPGKTAGKEDLNQLHKEFDFKEPTPDLVLIKPSVDSWGSPMSVSDASDDLDYILDYTLPSSIIAEGNQTPRRPLTPDKYGIFVSGIVQEPEEDDFYVKGKADKGPKEATTNLPIECERKNGREPQREHESESLSPLRIRRQTEFLVGRRNRLKGHMKGYKKYVKGMFETEPRKSILDVVSLVNNAMGPNILERE